MLKCFSKGFPFFHAALTPYVHFVPIKPDLSDLVERVVWLQKNDELASQIGSAGRRFAQEVLSPGAVRTYVRRYLDLYAEVLPNANLARVESGDRLFVSLRSSNSSARSAESAGLFYAHRKSHDHLARPVEIECPAASSAPELQRVSSPQDLAEEYEADARRG